MRWASRKGDCWDNAVAESFFSTLKTELGQDLTFESHQVAVAVLGAFIDCFYNSKRGHSFLDYASPIGFELQSQVAAMAA